MHLMQSVIREEFEVIMRLGLLAILALTIATSGCSAGRATGVPWWRAVPLMVIAPSSQEAEAYRRYLHSDKRRQPAPPQNIERFPIEHQGEPVPHAQPLPSETNQ